MLNMTKPITSKDYAGRTMTLVDATTLQPINERDVRTSSRGDQYVVNGGRAPHKPESSGKVWVSLTPFGSFAASMRDQREPAYSEAELATCWGELSASEQAEWADKPGSMEYYPTVIDAKWHALQPDRDNIAGATPGASSVLADEADLSLGPVPCVVCGKPVRRMYERHRYCSVACWDADPANAEHAMAPSTISRINATRRKAIKAAMAKRRRPF
jgi:hypothetical protein